MEVEPEEVVAVSVAEEPPALSVNPGSERALLLPEEDGCHRAVPPCYCILQMNTADFNRALKIIFLLCAVLTTVLYLDFCLINQSLAFAVFLGILAACTRTIGPFAVVFALCVDVERPGFNCRPIPKCMVTWTRYKLKEYYNRTTTELLPHHIAALRRYVQHTVNWLKK